MDKSCECVLTKDYFLQEDSSSLQELFYNIDKALSVGRPVPGKYRDKLPELMAIMDHLEHLRNSHENLEVFVNRSMEVITIRVKDVLGKKQFLALNTEDNGKFSVVQHSLPELDELSCEFEDLVSAVEVFSKVLEELSDYFEMMADLDESCWVIDPVKPSSKDNFRRIVIGENLSIVVTVDCRCGREFPRVSVLGPSTLVTPLCEKVHKYAELWDPQLGALNLIKMLDLSEFPQKTGSKEVAIQKIELECAICLASRDGSATLPSVVCENPSCRLDYHKACLYQWLSAVSGNVQTFNVIHGECPACSTPISCPVIKIHAQ